MDTKICNRCIQQLSFDKFSADRSKRDGRHTICKACKGHQQAQARERLKQDPSWILQERERSRKYLAKESTKQQRRDYLKRYKANPQNIERIRLYNQEYNQLPEVKLSARLRKYKLSTGQFQELVRLEDGRCAVCSKEFSDDSQVRIDHDHTTGDVRGLVCQKCNMSLGLNGDNLAAIQQTLQQQVAYLTRKLPSLSVDPSQVKSVDS